MTPDDPLPASDRDAEMASLFVRARAALTSVINNLNFFRVHLVSFIAIPVLFSLLFYCLNDARRPNDAFVSYVDSLFLCVSAGTISGLFPVVLSNLETGQQVILALLSTLGSYSFVAMALVVTRRFYFVREMGGRMGHLPNLQSPVSPFLKAAEAGLTSPQRSAPNVIREQHSRIPQPVNSNHEQVSGASAALNQSSTNIRTTNPHSNRVETGPAATGPAADSNSNSDIRLRRTDPESPYTGKDRGYGGYTFPFAPLRMIFDFYARHNPKNANTLLRKFRVPHKQYLRSSYNPSPKATPTDLPVKTVPYLLFDAVVGKNSSFLKTSEEEREELRYMEFAALNLLAWAIPAYWFGMQAIAFAIVAPYMARSQFQAALSDADSQAAPVNSTWFTLFQIISSFSSCGILVDASLLPFQEAYLLIWVMIVLIIAGNVGFPCFVRFFIWLGSKFVRKETPLFATLRFLLDHPRRCFLYLFPRTQTWYLLLSLTCLNLFDWVAFLLFDIADGPIASIPTGVRVLAGFFQAISIRCAGFHAVNLTNLAPAIQILYVVMMYISPMPLSLGVATTNVYEDRSVAINERAADDDDDTSLVYWHPGKSKTQIWGEYMTWHIRRQLSHDLWFLAAATMAICALERGKILDPNTSSYVTVFSILFEVVSAYETVGLSLGIPNSNACLSGVFSTTSKLLMCLIMLRGRHSGLPAAIDRATLLPKELKRQSELEIEFLEREDVVREALRRTREPKSDMVNRTGDVETV